MISDLNVPLEVAAGLCAAFWALGAWVGRQHAMRRVVRPLNPLKDLMQPAALAEAIDLAVRRDAVREASHAVLHGRIDQLAGLRDVWSPDIREQVRNNVAAVMRAGLRREDRFTDSEEEGFTIAISGADERAAVAVADRLRRALAQLRMPNLGSEYRLTTSFGVAAHRRSDNRDQLNLRARLALHAAVAKGEDHVISASEIEEVLYLPAPNVQPTQSAA